MSGEDIGSPGPGGMHMQKVLRILIVEDDAARERRLIGWLPPDFRAVVARTGGAAAQTIRLDPGDVYAGVILDHDLEPPPAVRAQKILTGLDVARSLIRHLSKSSPVLVHSMNKTHAAAVVRLLEGAGFAVTQIPMAELNRDRFVAWLEEIRNRR